ncbi:protein METABOLIC NETWORK MODULATOR 1 [Hevea brasiliensis]|uniref:protein METABOLIC NETWORK MODULATOR 1 n=1 Tax=Hevea brasiliensis TaxID=3981 RepID=UPI0026014F4A|nr:protein METABOLIC NETWORK MODULATOR 1 [Hevea brasiliensis]
MNPNPNHGESSHVPPGFVGVNGGQPHQVDSANDATDVMVGQVVHGVIEAAFDAGYLLTVRVGNSETTLRGVVFKSGRYVPVSTDNDVAPGVQMIRRNEIPIPRDRNGIVHTARAANPITSEGKQVPSMANQTPVISRGNVVPVLLQPVDLSNGNASGPSSAATQPTDAVAFKGKRVLDAAHPSNGSTPTNQVLAVETQLLHFQSQNDHQLMSSSIQKEASVNQNLAAAQQDAEAKSMKLPEDDISDTDQPLSVEPLQSVQPALHNHPAVVSRPLVNYRTAKMTELLQVLQENMTENQATQVQDETTDARLKLDELRSSEI